MQITPEEAQTHPRSMKPAPLQVGVGISTLESSPYSSNGKLSLRPVDHSSNLETRAHGPNPTHHLFRDNRQVKRGFYIYKWVLEESNEG